MFAGLFVGLVVCWFSVYLICYIYFVLLVGSCLCYLIVGLFIGLLFDCSFVVLLDGVFAWWFMCVLVHLFVGLSECWFNSLLVYVVIGLFAWFVCVCLLIRLMIHLLFGYLRVGLFV